MTDLDAKAVMLSCAHYAGMRFVVYLGYFMGAFLVGLMGFILVAVNLSIPPGWGLASPVVFVLGKVTFDVFKKARRIHAASTRTRWTMPSPNKHGSKQSSRCSP